MIRTTRRTTLIVMLAVILGLLVLATGCTRDDPNTSGQAHFGSEEATGSAEATASDDPTATDTPSTEEDGLYTPSYTPTGDEVAVIKTSQGDITVELYGKDAPIHVGNFVELVKKGFYNDTKFHRFEPGFVIQGGDPNTRELSGKDVAAQAGQPGSRLGTGGPGYMIKGEFDPNRNPNKHVEGALGMARSQSPDSAGSQFYFTLAATPFLDGQYTVFGKVTKGLDVVKKLRAGDVIESVELVGATE